MPAPSNIRRSPILAPASRVIGDYPEEVGDLMGDDDEFIGYATGDLLGLADELEGEGDFEMGRRVRRAVRRRMARRGQTIMSRTEAAQLRANARMAENKATNLQALASNQPMTAGRFVADDGQRDFYTGFSDTVQLGSALNSGAVLRTIVQRTSIIERVILAAVDNTALTDVLLTIGVTGIFVGVDPIFNANGVAPAVGFRETAVGVQLQSMVARPGIELTVNLRRIVATVAPSTVSGSTRGVSAQV